MDFAAPTSKTASPIFPISAPGAAVETGKPLAEAPLTPWASHDEAIPFCWPADEPTGAAVIWSSSPGWTSIPVSVQACVVETVRFEVEGCCCCGVTVRVGVLWAKQDAASSRSIGELFISSACRNYRGNREGRGKREPQRAQRITEKHSPTKDTKVAKNPYLHLGGELPSANHSARCRGICERVTSSYPVPRVSHRGRCRSGCERTRTGRSSTAEQWGRA